MKKIIRKRTGEVATLKEYLLEECGEDWRIIPKERFDEEEEVDVKPTILPPKIKEEKEDCIV